MDFSLGFFANVFKLQPRFSPIPQDNFERASRYPNTAGYSN